MKKLLKQGDMVRITNSIDDLKGGTRYEKEDCYFQEYYMSPAGEVHAILLTEYLRLCTSPIRDIEVKAL